MLIPFPTLLCRKEIALRYVIPDNENLLGAGLQSGACLKEKFRIILHTQHLESVE